MRRRTKFMIAGVAVLGIVGISAINAFRGGDDAVTVRVEPVQKRDLESTVVATGWIRPHRKVDVQSDIQGRITELMVREGEAVQKDQLLLRIDPRQYEAALERAKAAVSEAKSRHAQTQANLTQAERDLERMRVLASAVPPIVTEQELEDGETRVMVQRQQLSAAEYGVQQAEAAVEEAEERLSKTVIRAPMNGIITRLNIDEGETAIVGTMNNAGSLLLTVADLSVMEAVVRVDETDIPRISVGDSALLQIDAFPRESFPGRVTEISHSSVRPPSSQSGTTQQAVDFEIVIQLDAPPADLRSDLSATADIVTEQRKQVLSIPIIALTVREDSAQAVPQEDALARAAASAAAGDEQDIEGVFVVRDGRAVFVPVQVGIAGREHFEVLSGLTENDTIVAGPYESIRMLQSGDAVRTTGFVPVNGPGVEIRR